MDTILTFVFASVVLNNYRFRPSESKKAYYNGFIYKTLLLKTRYQGLSLSLHCMPL